MFCVWHASWQAVTFPSPKMVFPAVTTPLRATTPDATTVAPLDDVEPQSQRGQQVLSVSELRAIVRGRTSARLCQCAEARASSAPAQFHCKSTSIAGSTPTGQHSGPRPAHMQLVKAANRLGDGGPLREILSSDGVDEYHDDDEVDRSAPNLPRRAKSRGAWRKRSGGTRVQTPEAAPHLQRSPFVKYDTRELSLARERRWLQEDDDYMRHRKQALRHGAASCSLALRSTSQQDLFEMRMFHGPCSIKVKASRPRSGKSWNAAVHMKRLHELHEALEQSHGLLTARPSSKVSPEATSSGLRGG